MSAESGTLIILTTGDTARVDYRADGAPVVVIEGQEPTRAIVSALHGREHIECLDGLIAALVELRDAGERR